MAVGTVKAENVHDGFAFGGIDELANAKKGIAARDAEKVGDARVRSRGVNLFVSVAELDFVVALENAEKRIAADGGVEKAGEFSGAEVAGFESEGFAGGVAKALELDDAAGGRKGKARGSFGLGVDELGEENFGTGGEAAAGHLLGVAHQFIEMNFGGGDESADAAAALDEAFAFEGSESVASGHQADLMELGEVALGGDGVTGLEVAGVDALADGVLDALIGGQAVAVFRGNSLARNGAGALGGGSVGRGMHSKDDILFYLFVKTGFGAEPRKLPKVL